jgi:hypothetical protein
MRSTSGTRDGRIFQAVQARLDIVEDEMADQHAQAERHWRLACWHLAQSDDLAVRHFELMVAIARVERRLIQAQTATTGQGRAA